MLLSFSMFGKDTYNKPVKDVEVFLCLLLGSYSTFTSKRTRFQITGSTVSATRWQ